MYAYFSYFSKCKPYLNTVRDSNAGKKVFDLKLFGCKYFYLFEKKLSYENGRHIYKRYFKL